MTTLDDKDRVILSFGEAGRKALRIIDESVTLDARRADYWEEECDVVEKIFIAAGIDDSVETKLANKAQHAVETIAKLNADNAALRALARRPHDVCEDSWYTCPKHPEGSSNVERVGSACSCGADEHNAKVDAVNPGAGWVSPEEYARLKAVLDATKATYLERSDEVAKLTADNAALRAEREMLRVAAISGPRSICGERRAAGLPHCGACIDCVARVKAEAEGLRALLRDTMHNAAFDHLNVQMRVRFKNALASPTPAIETVDTDDVSKVLPP